MNALWLKEVQIYPQTALTARCAWFWASYLAAATLLGRRHEPKVWYPFKVPAVSGKQDQVVMECRRRNQNIRIADELALPAKCSPDMGKAAHDDSVHLALAIGCITGYPLVLPTLALGALLGGLGALGVLLWGWGDRRSTLPYGPYLIIGVLYVLARGTTMHPFP